MPPYPSQSCWICAKPVSENEPHRHDEFGFPIPSECDFKLKADKNASLPDTRSKGAQNSKQPTTLGLLRGNNLEAISRGRLSISTLGLPMLPGPLSLLPLPCRRQPPCVRPLRLSHESSFS